MGTEIKISDLPSRKFDDLKNYINYDTLQNYNKDNTSYSDISCWVDNFEPKIETYLAKQNFKELIKKDKCCKDFNYIIEQILQKIQTLFDEPVQKFTLTNKIKEWRKKFFRVNQNLMCNENSKYGDFDLKPLYDFCEDIAYIKEKISDIEKSDQCKIILSDMSSIKSQLKKNASKLERQIKLTIISDISCSTTIINEPFPSFECKSNAESASERGRHIGSRESGHELTTQIPYSLGNIQDGGRQSLQMKSESETHSGSSSNVTGLVSLPVMGILALSFFAYKYTPIGSKFLAYFRNKEHISINKDDETTNQMLFNASDLNTYSEDVQYNVSYQTM
ncbi:PIR Superfamily Protein [Plasmodium ovale curtisi]|uniref:PIR Superfamily Protein n=1 Tax=Plasmodium ovale curtisi TaxID=864141 RepID=A0A1A8XGF5_PLAOA|nr:PIR Superfamily Protein [Plasmodium ovale curtisi]